jgi:oligopeptide transport system ATP-binding protein
MSNVMLSVKNLIVNFKTHNGMVKAVRGIDFELLKGETLAIVGESGCGKSVTSKAIMGLLAENAKIGGGEIVYDGVDLLSLSEDQISAYRGKEIAMVFQDPMTSLDPVMTIGNQIIEGLMINLKLNLHEAHAKAVELITKVGIDNPTKRMKQYPHQFSGGMRQRIVIAIALSCNPKILICDEPTTALDVTTQAQILELIKDLQRELGISVIFITHDLGVVANMSDRVAVMYAGKIIEIGSVDEVYYNPQHPYTWGLLASIPAFQSKKHKLYAIPGAPPQMINPPQGDAFAARSEYAMKIDFELEPPLFKVSDTHYAATWLLHPYAKKVSRPEQLQERIDQLLARGV